MTQEANQETSPTKDPRSEGFENYDARVNPLTPGKQVYLRTVTMHFTGRVVEVTAQEILLEDAAWIADGTRWAHMLATGELKEVEPYPDGVIAVGRGALVDASHWMHPLPREVEPGS